MKHSRKWLSMFMVLVMLIGMFGLTASASSDEEGGPNLSSAVSSSEQYVINIEFNANQGSATLEKDLGWYEWVKYKNFRFSATPKTGYTFDGWYEGSTKLTSESSFLFRQRIHNAIYQYYNDPSYNKTYTAKFIANDVNVTVVDGETSNTTTHKFDDQLAMPTPTGKDHYDFSGWSITGDYCTVDSSTDIILKGNVTLTAQYEIKQYKVVVTNTGNGTGTVTGAGTFDALTDITLSVVADEGSTFMGWFDGETDLGTENLNFSLQSDRILTALFKKPITKVSPVFEGWTKNGSTYNAYFGYKNESTDVNDNPVEVTIATGNQNKVTGYTGGTAFPTEFAIGRTPYFPNAVIEVTGWDGSNIVWTLNGRTATASLNAGLEHKSFVEVKPIFEGWVDNGDGTYNAYFGYLNNSTDPFGNAMIAEIPQGNDNKVTGFTGTTTFPTEFATGRTPYFPNAAIVVTGWDGSNIVWKLGNRTATASLAEGLKKELPVVEDETPIIRTQAAREVPNVTLQVKVNGPGSVTPGSGSYSLNSIVDMTVTPDEGFEFLGWAGDNKSDVKDGDRITMDGNKVLEANFGLIIEDDATAETAPIVIETEETVTEEPAEEVITEEVVAIPLATPVLPKTGGIPLFLLSGIGAVIATGGLFLGKRKKITKE